MSELRGLLSKDLQVTLKELCNCCFQPQKGI